MKDIFTNSKCLSQAQIKEYLSEKLGDDQRYQVENHLLDCPLCTDAVEGFATFYNFEEDTTLEELETKLSETIKKDQAIEPQEAKRISINRFNRIAAAAMIVLLPLAGFLYWSAIKEEDLFQAYYKPLTEEPLLALRSGNDTKAELDIQLKKAFELFQQKKYKESIVQFEGYFLNKPEDANAAFFAGIAYLEENRLEEAIEFLTIARFNDQKHFEDANWYLALAHLKSGQQAEAKPILEDLTKNKGGFYFEQAMAILDKIK